MIQVKVFQGIAVDKIEKLNNFLSTANVVDLKYQMTDENDTFIVVYEVGEK